VAKSRRIQARGTTKKTMTKALLLFLLGFTLLGKTAAYGQQTGEIPSPDEQLAVQYYQSGDFEKALVYYEKLFNKKQSQIYYTYYVDCLIHVKDYKKAEKVIRKQIRNYPYDLTYRVDLGTLYKNSGSEDKAKKEYEKAIKDIQPNQAQVFDLAHSFTTLHEYDYAIATYMRARKLIDFYPFNFELAELYDAKKEYAAMANEYLDAIEADEHTLQSVQNVMQDKFSKNNDPKKNEILKNELLRRIQKNGDRTIFSELLLWMFIQQKEFDAALVQAKALDKRKKEEGTRVMALANICVSNEAYDVAIKCYQYIIKLGPESYFFENARLELLTATNKKLRAHGSLSKNELLELEKMYKQTLADLGKNASTARAMQELAHLEAFYLYNSVEAEALLNEVESMTQVSPLTEAECKLELGDILLLDGDIWEASLKYSQVEKAYKHDPIGQEAKFRNAKVGYYTGDFKWAEAQLNVLKGATSKLIANDAMELSLRISENMAEDTNTLPLIMFARAELLSFRNKDSLAILTLDSITKLFPAHALSDDILFKKAAIRASEGRYEEAIGFYEKIVKEYGTDVLADDALFHMAELYEEKIGNKVRAMDLYQDVLTKYPGSVFTVEARKRYRALRGDVLN
jgi:tetratricopeptide (TPR) repeat protein